MICPRHRWQFVSCKCCKYAAHTAVVGHLSRPSLRLQMAPASRWCSHLMNASVAAMITAFGHFVQASGFDFQQGASYWCSSVTTAIKRTMQNLPVPCASGWRTDFAWKKSSQFLTCKRTHYRWSVIDTATFHERPNSIRPGNGADLFSYQKLAIWKNDISW